MRAAPARLVCQTLRCVCVVRLPAWLIQAKDLVAQLAHFRDAIELGRGRAACGESSHAHALTHAPACTHASLHDLHGDAPTHPGARQTSYYNDTIFAAHELHGAS